VELKDLVIQNFSTLKIKIRSSHARAVERILQRFTSITSDQTKKRVGRKEGGKRVRVKVGKREGGEDGRREGCR
jgi:hypothetical protein